MSFYYGGQAVIEGVMMRGRRSLAITLRRPDGDVLVQSRIIDYDQTEKYRQLPVVRGVFALWEAVVLGIQALLLSAQIAGGKDERPSAASIGLALAFALSLVATVFFAGPLLLTAWLGSVIHNNLVVLFVEGAVRLAMLLGYVAGIGALRDVRRVFEYHGAEHKTINAYEAGDPLEVEYVRRHSTAHTRCGTGFLLVVMVFSVVIFAALGTPPFWLRLVSRVVLIPLIAALAYEYVRFAASHVSNPLIRWLIRPNLALQSFTTREPDDGQLEIAISALQAVLALDGVPQAGEPIAVSMRLKKHERSPVWQTGPAGLTFTKTVSESQSVQSSRT